MDLNLSGKRALVTGGSKGIGLAIKKALEAEGVEVISWSRSEGVDLMKKIPSIPDNLNILINNIGGFGSLYPMYEDEMVLHMKKNFEIMDNLTTQFMGDNDNGIIITISSIYGKERGDNIRFTASKAAQIAYMKSLSGINDNFRFNTICPGHIDVGKKFPDNPKIIGNPEDVANIVTFLCSDKAKHINGACITVDGGESHSF